MKNLIATAVVLFSIASAWAEALPGMVQIRVYRPNQTRVDEETGMKFYSLINEETGLPVRHLEIINRHSTIYDFANDVEFSRRDNTVLLLSRKSPGAGTTLVTTLNFASAEVAANFKRHLVLGNIASLTFPYTREEYLDDYADNVIVRRR